MSTVKQALLWIAIGALTSPIWGTLVWVLWQGTVRPRLIPRREIDALAGPLWAPGGGGSLRRRESGLAQFGDIRARKMAAGAPANLAPGFIHKNKKMRT